MMRLTRTGIGLLTAQYRSVLKKCALINAGLFFALAPSVAEAVDNCASRGGIHTVGSDYYVDGSKHYDCYFAEKPTAFATRYLCTKLGCGYYAHVSEVPQGPYEEGDAGYGKVYATPQETYADTELMNSIKENDLQYALTNTVSGKYISKNKSVADNLNALDYALDNNYYRNIKFSRAEKLQKTSAVIVRSAKHDVTIFGRKSDKTALCAEILQSLCSFRMTESVANDNHATTTGNTTMYKKEA